MTDKGGDNSEIKELIRSFPTSPGVYLMKNHREKIIYVGKAKSLRDRVRSYFNKSSQQSAKTTFLVKHIRKIDYILTKTEVEAFLLEASLIKKHRPRYNIRLKDDKSYPYIKITIGEEYPRLYLTRKVIQDGSFYFGPYTSSQSVRETIRFLNRSFKIRDCRDHFMKSRKRPCMTYQIGRCTAPCVGYIQSDQYKDDVSGAVRFLKGEAEGVLAELESRMLERAETEQFEAAAQIRDSWRALKSILDRQIVVNETQSAERDQDVFAFCGDERGTLIESLHIRKGRLIGSQSHFFSQIDSSSNEEDPKDWFTSFLSQYYLTNVIPDQVILSVDLGLDIFKLLRDLLGERGKSGVQIGVGADGAGQELIHMALKNAQAHFEGFVSKSQKKLQGLEEIQRKLKLPSLPERIEGFDISHFQGSETVAAQVVFEEGVPNKDLYRRYRVRTVQGVDDYASMKEVLTRRFGKDEQEDPQLVLIDGGKGQLKVAVQVLKDLGKSHLPVVGLAKARTRSDFESESVEVSEERFFLPGRQNPVLFRASSEAYRILVGIRDEAHRFAVSYHRALREKGALESSLQGFPGLGPERIKKLLTGFESLEDIVQADPRDIMKIGGISLKLAEMIKTELDHGKSSLESEGEPSEKT